MTLELFEQGPSVYIPYLLISLLITLAAYGAYPLLYAKFQNEPITAKRYRRICFLANLIPMLLFFFLADSSSGWPYVLWTSVFSSVGKQILERRNLLADPDTPAPAPSSSPSSDAAVEFTGKFQQSAASVPAPVNLKKSKSRFCKICGNPIDLTTKKCTGCGKQYFRLRVSPSDIFFFIIIVLALSIAFLSIHRIGQLNMRISEFETELASTKQTSSELQDKYTQKYNEAYDLSQENKSLKNKVANMEQVYNFCNNHIVVVSDDGTRKYHKIQCVYFDDSYFWAYNTEKAVQLGYTPCSFCFSRYFDSLMN